MCFRVVFVDNGIFNKEIKNGVRGNGKQEFLIFPLKMLCHKRKYEQTVYWYQFYWRSVVNDVVQQKKLTFICPHAEFCSGCLPHIKIPSAVGKIRRFFTPWHLEVPYEAGPETGWRSRAKLAVRASKDGCAVGLFKEGSHDVVDISFCSMHTIAINRALDVCLRSIRADTSVSFYNEATHTGALRYILLSEETTSSKVSIVFVLNLKETDLETKRWQECARSLFINNPSLFHSFWLNFQSDISNTIAGKVCQYVTGELWQWEKIQEVWLPFKPLHFRQANLPLFSVLLRDLEMHIPNSTRIVDLFGGMGAIGLCLCHKATRVECVEIDPAAQSSFEEARKRLPKSMQPLVSFHCLSCNGAEIEGILDRAETVIVDPPRKGLSNSLIELISKSSASTLVYISCCAETLLKNLSVFIQKGWQPVFAKTYQFFPKTDHVESLVFLTKKSTT